MLARKPDARLCGDIASRADIAPVCLRGILRKNVVLPARHPDALFFARSIVATLHPCSQASACKPGLSADIFLWHRAGPSRLVQIRTAFGISPRFPLTLLRHVSVQSHLELFPRGKESALPRP